MKPDKTALLAFIVGYVKAQVDLTGSTLQPSEAIQNIKDLLNKHLPED